MSAPSQPQRQLGLLSFLGHGLPYLRPYWPQLALVALGAVLEVAFNVAFPLSIRALIDLAITPGDATNLVQILLVLTVLFLVSASAGIGADFALARIASRLLNDLKLELFTHLQLLSAGFFARAQVSELVSHSSTDVPIIAHGLTRALAVVGRCVLQLVVSIVILFALEWHLALVTVAALPLALLGPRALAGRAGPARAVQTTYESRVLSLEQQNIEGQAVVRGFGVSTMLAGQLQQQLAVFGQAFVRANFLTGLVGRSTTVAVTLVQLVVIGLGAFLTFQHFLSTGSLIGFMGLLVFVGGAFSGLSQALPECLEAANALRRVEAVLAERPSVADAAGAESLPRLAREIQLEHVSFGYTQPQRILKDVSLVIPAGEKVAFVGRSGSGKSTILNLITRFYDPLQGSVSFDGHDVRGVTQDSLRRQMGIVFQESYLFNTSIRENIRVGRLDASDDEVEAAARAAQIHEVIATMPGGYDSPVGERGGQLSGGQRQRLALARAILRDPAVLVLDEATSALDPGTEAAFNATLATLAADRTVLSVTHRLGSITGADRIFVLDAGLVVEEGTHQELLEKGGVYCALWQQQSGFAVSEDGRQAEVAPDRLGAIPLFQQLAPHELTAVANRFVSEHFAAGATIIRRGEAGQRFYVVVRGTVEVLGDDDKILSVLQDGDFFGELALLDDSPRTATVRARSPSLLLTLARQQFVNLLRVEPGIRATIMETATARRHRPTSVH